MGRIQAVRAAAERGQPGRPNFFLRELFFEHGLGDGAAANVTDAHDEDVVHG